MQRILSSFFGVALALAILPVASGQHTKDGLLLHLTGEQADPPAGSAHAVIDLGKFAVGADDAVVGDGCLRYDPGRPGRPFIEAELPTTRIKGLEAVTVSLWAKSGRATGFLFSCGFPDDDFLWMFASNRRERFLALTIGGEKHRYPLPEAFDPSPWRHYALVLDLGGDRRARIYIDGELFVTSHSFGGGDFYEGEDGHLVGTVGNYAFEGDTLPLSPAFRIGGIKFAGNAWQGHIDDFRLFSRPLTPSEIAELAQANQPQP